MNCASAEKLLPLYARVDLDRAGNSAIAAHLESCARCRQLADEYKNIQSWIRLHEPPEFNEEFFAGIRQNVLREISQKPVGSSTFSSWLGKLFVPAYSQTKFAAATAALLIICGAIGLFVLYNNEGTAGMSAKVEPTNNAIAVTPVTPSTEAKPETRQETKNDPRSAVTFRRSSAKSLNRVRRGTAGITPAVVRPPAQETLASQDPLRVEMQTQNPDIRIIWFANNSKQSSSTN